MWRSVSLVLMAALVVSLGGCAKGCGKSDKSDPAARSEAPAEPVPSPDKPTT